MPTSYREAFGGEDVEAHAGIVARRSGSATRVEIWKAARAERAERAERAVGVCIVADDRPGLLSQISAALVALEIDVVSAHAYCRTRPDGAREAIDLLWLRRVAGGSGAVRATGGVIGERDVVAIGEMVDGLVRGSATFDASVRLARRVRSATESTRVLFDDGTGDGTMVLTVEATDRPGLLLVVTKAIFRAEFQIIGLRATSNGGRAVDRFHLAELDGRPLVQARLLSLQVEIFAALEDGESEGADGVAGGAVVAG